MIKRFKVHSDHKPKDLSIDVYSVFKTYNPHKIIVDFDGEQKEEWEFDEDEMTLEEYFRETIPDNQFLTEKTLAELSNIIAMYQEQVDATLGELSILLQEAIENNV